MIIISGQVLRPQDIANWQTEESLVPYINDLLNSPVQFDYGSIAELMFEVRLRRHIVEAARELHGSGVKFATFAKTYGNTAYWRVTPEGALELKYRIPASKAIRDIIENGAFYAFECATAIVVIYYLAVLKTIGEERFNRRFRISLCMTGTMSICRSTRKPAATFYGEIVYILKILILILQRLSGGERMSL